MGGRWLSLPKLYSAGPWGNGAGCFLTMAQGSKCPLPRRSGDAVADFACSLPAVWFSGAGGTGRTTTATKRWRRCPGNEPSKPNVAQVHGALMPVPQITIRTLPSSNE